MNLSTCAKSVLVMASSAVLLCCSAAKSDGKDGMDEGATGAPAQTEGAQGVPTAPENPLPSMLNLPHGGSPSSTPPSTTPPSTPPTTPAAGRTLRATDSGNRVVTFTSGSPDKIVAHALTGLAAGERIVGLSYVTGGLRAVGTTSHMFDVDALTGAAKRVAEDAFAQPLDGVAFGFAFDPVSKLTRVVSDNRENLRIDMNGVVTNVDGTLAFQVGDKNAASVPHVVAAAYTSGGKAYAIDTQANVLVELLDSYSGQMRTVGALGVDAGDSAGFDISGVDAFAALRVGNTTGLYTIDLATGAAKLVGAIGVDTAITGLAIAP